MTPHEIQLLSPLILAGSLLGLWRVFRAIKSGSINSLAGRHQRTTDPQQFWFYVVTTALFALTLFTGGILGALRVIPGGP